MNQFKENKLKYFFQKKILDQYEDRVSQHMLKYHPKPKFLPYNQ